MRTSPAGAAPTGRFLRRWHGVVVILAALAAAHRAPAQSADVARVRTQAFDIDYAVNVESHPLTEVVLWYTLDRGQTWHRYAVDEDRQSPMAFTAPGEGLIGFFVQASNQAGESSLAPTPSTRPHAWAFVDYTPPIIQLHEALPAPGPGGGLLQVRWTAIDRHFLARPIELSYRTASSEQWLPATAEPLANTGRCDWRVPDGLTGRIQLRATVRDEGGHAVVSEPVAAEIPIATTNLLTAADRSVDHAPPTSATPAAPVSTDARQRALRLFKEALIHRDGGDSRESIVRLRQAAALDPELTDAFVELGRQYYLLGRIDEAGGAYEVALRQQPRLRSALRGAAMVDRKSNNYAAAEEKLRTILRDNPNDAEVWLNLGDVAVFGGNEKLARECYQRAATVDPAAVEVIETARKWLDLIETARGGSAAAAGGP